MVKRAPGGVPPGRQEVEELLQARDPSTPRGRSEGVLRNGPPPSAEMARVWARARGLLENLPRYSQAH